MNTMNKELVSVEAENLGVTIEMSCVGEGHNVVAEISYAGDDSPIDGVFETAVQAFQWVDEIGYVVGEYDVDREGDSWSIRIEL